MCRPKSQGGRRCPSHSDPTRIAARNAKRRESYKNHKSEMIEKIIVERTVGENVSNAVSESSFKRSFLNQNLKNDAKISDLFKPKNQTIESKKINITSSENEGELVDQNYFSGKRVSGTVNYNNLDENSYKEFGFKEISDSPEDYYYMDRRLKVNLEDFEKLSQLELEQMSQTEKAALKFFTSNQYRWFNDAIYSNGKSLKDEFNAFAGEPPFEANSYGEYNLSNANIDKNAENVKIISEKLDEAFENAPKIQRVVYRGKKAHTRAFEKYGGDVGKWIEENAKLGQEVKFDGYQSTTADIGIAASYSGQHAGDPGLIYEIMTPEGVNLSSISEYEEEREILLPRDSRYMVVGVHKNQKLNSFEGKAYVIQLVAINDKGEVLTGENSSALKPVLSEEGEK